MSWIEDVFENEYVFLLDTDPYHERSKRFRKIFQYLIDLGRDYYFIVETGSIRDLGQWDEGQSTILFDSFVNYYDGEVISIDNNPDCAELIEKTASNKTNAITGNSLEVYPH